MKRIDLAMLFALLLSLAASWTGLFGERCELITQESLRLHIIANSDSEQDQTLKLRIRDRILAEFSAELIGVTPSQAREEAAKLLERMVNCANDEIQRAGFCYRAQGEIANMYFPTRKYDRLTMPAGRYDAVRILLGEGEGQNWWCVLYPPLCVAGAICADGDELTGEITQLSQEQVFQARFAVVETIESIREKIHNAQKTNWQIPDTIVYSD